MKIRKYILWFFICIFYVLTLIYLLLRQTVLDVFHLIVYLLSLSILSDCYYECRQPEGFSNSFSLFIYPVSSLLPNDSVEHRVIIISGFLMFLLHPYTGNHIYTAFPAPRKAYYFRSMCNWYLWSPILHYLFVIHCRDG